MARRLSTTREEGAAERTEPAPKRVRRRLTPEARRGELLACALRVFARRGLGEGRHAEIAREAGVSIPTVFFYFPTREALVDAVLGEVERFYRQMAHETHVASVPAKDVILSHLRKFAESVDSSPDHARIWLDWSTAVRERIWGRYLEFLESMIVLVRDTLERGHAEGDISSAADAEDQARLLIGSGHMMALMKMSGSPPEKLEHFFGTLLHAVLGSSR